MTHSVVPDVRGTLAMLACVHTAALRGIDAYGVRVEVNLSTGLPAFLVVGLAHGSVREGRERVAAALRNRGFGLPNRRITVNLAPADVRKEGSAFDLPIAVGVLAAAGAVSKHSLGHTLFVGELGLDGTVRPVRGVLSFVLWARQEGLRAVVVPSGNEHEARLVDGIEVVGVDGLTEALSFLEGQWAPRRQADPPGLESEPGCPSDGVPDLADVRGQRLAKRALEIVAAGHHHLRLVGPPGSGKTMLARRLPGLLPPLTLTERIEVARIRSVAGPVDRRAVMGRRPFRAPHHSVSYAGLVGGGTPLRPGEISLAHHGVLFLDELSEYRRGTLEVLRQPLEEGHVTLVRASGALSFPAGFVLVAAMNPCPCGYLGDGSDRCTCDAATMARHRARISGPLLDRIGLHVHVGSVDTDELQTPRSGPTSREVASRVARAREVQTERFREREGLSVNGHMGPADLDVWCSSTGAALRLLRRAVAHEKLSARGYDRVRRVARTIADLDGDESISEGHVAEALQYRREGH